MFIRILAIMSIGVSTVSTMVDYENIRLNWKSPFVGSMLNLEWETEAYMPHRLAM